MTRTLSTAVSNLLDDDLVKPFLQDLTKSPQ